MKNHNRTFYQKHRRHILKGLFFSAYLICMYAAAKKGTGIETAGAIVFITLVLNIPSVNYIVMFSRYGVYEGDSSQKSWISCKVAAIIYELKGDGRNALVIDLSE